jgi:hypothetical protein
MNRAMRCLLAAALLFSIVGCSSSSKSGGPNGIKGALAKAGLPCDLDYRVQTGAEYAKAREWYGEERVVASRVLEEITCSSSTAGSVDLVGVPGVDGTNVVPFAYVDEPPRVWCSLDSVAFGSRGRRLPSWDVHRSTRQSCVVERSLR